MVEREMGTLFTHQNLEFTAVCSPAMAEGITNATAEQSCTGTWNIQREVQGHCRFHHLLTESIPEQDRTSAQGKGKIPFPHQKIKCGANIYWGEREQNPQGSWGWGTGS